MAQTPLDSYDYLIVGAGPAGCLLANRLSADPGVSVLLIEAGGRDNYPWIHIPVGYLYCIGNPRTDWCYNTEADPGLHGRALKYPRGRVLGGCSSINGMIYMRGQAADYDGWAAAGNPGWAWRDVLPLFKRSEHHFAGASDLHGGDGEWRVERQRLSWDILEAFREAAAQSGIARIDDFNGGDNEGCSYFQVNQKRGVRWNASKAFLRDIRQRPNLRVLTGAEAERLELEGGRASALWLRWQGRAIRVAARREIVLCAGAIGSPALLQRSGIGPRALLERLGIGVNSLWPRTAIATAALQMIPGVDVAKCRTPAILADAAYLVLTSDPKTTSGNFFIDDTLLAQHGVTARVFGGPGVANLYFDDPSQIDRAMAVLSAAFCVPRRSL